MDHVELQKKLSALGCTHPAIHGDSIWVQSYFLKRSTAEMLVEAFEGTGKSIRVLRTRDLALLAGHPYEKDRHMTPEYVLKQIRAKPQTANARVAELVH